MQSTYAKETYGIIGTFHFETNQRAKTNYNAHIIKPSELMVFSTNPQNINSYEFKIKHLQECSMFNSKSFLNSND